MEPFRVRPEEPADAEAVAAVNVRAWQRGYADTMPAEFLARLDPAAWAQRRREHLAAYPDGPFVSLVAEDGDGRIGGFTTVGPYQRGRDPADLDHAYGEILAIYVDPPRWGTGMGRALMAAAVSELASRGFAEVRLWVLADNVRARRFYERVGLFPDGATATFRLDGFAGAPADTDAGAGVELVEIRYAGRLPESASR